MKFQVSVLSDKGVKKVVLTVDADRFHEVAKEENGIFLSHTRIQFYADNPGSGFLWTNQEILVAIAQLSGSYVVEQVTA